MTHRDIVDRILKIDDECSACGGKLLENGGVFVNPCTNCYICGNCNEKYHTGSFTGKYTRDIYCRWCGDGGEYLLECDHCTKAFCNGCLTRNLGRPEVLHLMDKNDGFRCLQCDGERMRSLVERAGWKLPEQRRFYHRNRRLIVQHGNHVGARQSIYAYDSGVELHFHELMGVPREPDRHSNVLCDDELEEMQDRADQEGSVVHFYMFASV